MYPITQDNAAIVQRIVNRHDTAQPSGLDYVAAAIMVNAAYKGGSLDRLLSALERTDNDSQRNNKKTA